MSISAANFFGAPVVGPYGQWTMFLGDVETVGSEGSDEDDEEDREAENDDGGEDEEAPGGPQGEKGAAKIRKRLTFFSPAIPPGTAPPPRPRPRTFAEILAEVEEEERLKAEREKASQVKDNRSESRGPPTGPGPVVADMCVAEGPGLLSGVSGDWCVFKVHVKNYKGETVSKPEGTLRLALEPLGLVDMKVVGDPWGNMAVGESRRDGRLRVAAGACRAPAFGAPPQLHWEVRESGTGEINVRYKHDVPGCYKLHVTYDGLPIAGAPFEIVLTSGAPCALASRVIGRGARICYASPSALEPTPELKKDKGERDAGDVTDLDRDDEEEEILPKSKRQKFRHFINQFKVVVCDTNGKP